MRNAIREKLLSEIPEFKDIYEPHVAGPEAEKPYGIIRQGVDTDENDWSGFRRIVEVWPYVSRSTFAEVDSLAKKVIKTLDQRLITDQKSGDAFSCIYLGTVGQDVVDSEWDAITRGLRFAVLALQHADDDMKVSSDPWITALSDWTRDILGDSWTVYENRLPLGYKRPCVLWRLDAYQAEGVNRAAFQVTKDVVGHAISRNPNQKIQAASLIAERLMEAIKVPLDIEDRRYMTVQQPRTDFKADGFNNGQISVRLMRKTSRVTEEVPVMAEIHASENWR